MYDSIDPTAIPADAAMVAGYVDGIYGPNHAAFNQPGWDADAWARFPNAVKVGIAVKPWTNYGQVGDVETGDMTPDGALGWVRMRRAAGQDPTLYSSSYAWQQIVIVFAQAGEPLPHWWEATLDGTFPWDGRQVAIQGQGEAQTGHHYDLSQVLDYWPGVDVAAPPGTPPPVAVADDGVLRY